MVILEFYRTLQEKQRFVSEEESQKRKSMNEPPTDDVRVWLQVHFILLYRQRMQPLSRESDDCVNHFSGQGLRQVLDPALTALELHNGVLS